MLTVIDSGSKFTILTFDKTFVANKTIELFKLFSFLNEIFMFLCERDESEYEKEDKVKNGSEGKGERGEPKLSNSTTNALSMI